MHWQLLQTIIFRIIGAYRIFTNDTRVSLCIYGMSFFCYPFRHSKEVLDTFVSGILFLLCLFCYVRRNINRMVHDVGACVVNALCVICPIKVVKICKIDKNRSEIQRKM